MNNTEGKQMMDELRDDLDDAEVSDAPRSNISTNGFYGGAADKVTSAPNARNSKRDDTRFSPCAKCRGSGRWVSFSHMSGGKCFKCNGTGNGLSLAPTAVAARARTERKITGRIQQAADFRAANPDITAWWAANTRFDFANSTSQALDTHGSLTDNQLAAIRKCIATSAARAVVRAQEREARTVSVSGEGFDKVLAMFTNARSNGLKRPKLTFERVVFSLAPNTGKNAGSIYVKGGRGYDADYLGKIGPDGRYQPMGGVAADLVAHIVAIGADPLGQAKLHGQRTGTCCMCNAELTNAASIEAGIGPICASKWGG